MIRPKIIISQKGITAANGDGQKVVEALKVFARSVDPETLLDLAESIKKDPDLIKKAMKFKYLLG